MVTTKDKPSKELTRDQICQYTWAKYIDSTKPPFTIDETAALHWFEKFYGKHPLNEDKESFFYGILLYEQAFSDEKNRDRYLVRAKEVLSVYREVTGDTEWDVVEDRYADCCEIIESEGLEGKVQARSADAKQIPGMVLVPGGPFPYGPDKKTTVLEAYYIDVYPVTNAEYRVFLEETKYRRPALWNRRPELAVDELPVTGVSWMDALQYCKWSNKSLPTAEQWEKAARGREGKLYPWGEDPPTPARANYRDAGGKSPELRPATDYDGTSESVFGVRAMVGGVWEWTNTNYADEEGAQLVKGGSWVDPPTPEMLSGMATLWANKKEKTDILGFRCTKPLAE